MSVEVITEASEWVICNGNVDPMSNYIIYFVLIVKNASQITVSQKCDQSVCRGIVIGM